MSSFSNAFVRSKIFGRQQARFLCTRPYLVKLDQVTVRPFRPSGASIYALSRELNREVDTDPGEMHSSLNIAKSSWTICPGEMWLVVGPNGSGKTTLCMSVAGKAHITSGDIFFGSGCSVKDFAYLSMKTDQNLALLARKVEETGGWNRLKAEDMKISRLIGPLIESAKKSNEDSLHQLASLLDEFKFSELFPKFVSELSTGQLRTVCIVQTLLQNPRVCILDEPFDGLDREARKRLSLLLESVAKLHRQSNLKTQLIVISHRASEIDSIPFITHLLKVEEGNRISFCGELDKLTHGGMMGSSILPNQPVINRVVFDEERNELLRELLNISLQQNDVLSNKHDPLVQMKDIQVRFAGSDKSVLDKLDLSIFPNKHLVIRGPNGAGKSVLIGLITGETTQVHSNNVRCFGRKRESLSLEEVRKLCGVLSPKVHTQFQTSHQSARKTILSGNIGLVGGYTPSELCDDEKLQSICSRWAKIFGVEHLMARSFTTLSQGEQRIVLLIRALMSGPRGLLPRLLLLDEPTHGLDVRQRNRFYAALDVVGSFSTIVLVTHHDEELPAFSYTNILELPLAHDKPIA